MTTRAIKTVRGGREYLVGGYSEDGYEFMAYAEEEGWRAIAGWGQDGWDLGSWPYVVYLFRERRLRGGAMGYEVLSYCEGDVEHSTYCTADAREADVDEIALFYWHGSEWAVDEDGNELPRDTPAESIPARLRGPYSHKRARAAEKEDIEAAGLTFNEDRTALELGLEVGDLVWSSGPRRIVEFQGEPGTQGHVYKLENGWMYGVEGRPSGYRRRES